MAVLYRDYRPKNFSEIVGQKAIKTTLQNAVAQGSFAHAYLFTGPRGTGKTSTARIFARAVNCPKAKNGEPDNTCDICIQFMAGKSLDLIEIDAASNTGVENVRELIDTLKFSPTRAKYKVFIIDEVHMLSKGAFNALLKTLEEPPAHAIFILATTEVHKVPATIISRTQRFDFKRIDHADVLEHLQLVSKKEGIKLDAASLQLVANASEGSMRDALSILDKLSGASGSTLEEVEVLLGITNVGSAQKFLDLLAAKDAQGSLQYLEELFGAGIDPIQFNKDFLEYLRKVLMVSTGASSEFALDKHQLEILHGHAKAIHGAQLLHIIRLFLKANKDFQASPSPELPLEIAAAEACLATGGILTPAVGTVQRPVQRSDDGTPMVSLKKKPLTSESSAPQPQESDAFAEGFAHSEILDDSPAPSSSSKPGRQVGLAELVSAWPEFLTKIKERQSTLLAVMKTMRLKGIDERNCITLVTDYKFHLDNLGQPKNRALLTGILADRFGTSFSLNLQVEKLSAGAEPGGDASSMAMEMFGGEIV